MAALPTNPEECYWYAHDVLKGPFPAGEPAISREASYSYKYARDVLKGPFPAGEAVLLTSMEYRSLYYREIRKLSRGGWCPWAVLEARQEVGDMVKWQYGILRKSGLEVRSYLVRDVRESIRFFTRNGISAHIRLVCFNGIDTEFFNFEKVPGREWLSVPVGTTLCQYIRYTERGKAHWPGCLGGWEVFGPDVVIGRVLSLYPEPPRPSGLWRPWEILEALE